MSVPVRRRAAVVATALSAVAIMVGVAMGGGATAGASTEENRRFVVNASHDFTGSAPFLLREDRWTSWLDEGRPRLDVTRPLAFSPEWNASLVDGLFRSVLDRPADSDGRGFWTEMLLQGRTPAAVAVALATSPESLDRGDRTGSGTADVLYRALLGRASDSGGRTHFGDRIDGGTSAVDVAVELYGSAESRSRRVDALYRRLLGRAADPAGSAHWSSQLVHIEDRELAAILAASAEYHRRMLTDPAPPTSATGPSTTSPTTTTSATTTSTTSTSTTSTSTTTTTVPQHPEPEHFEGSLADFYVVPDPLPAGAPGTLIRYQDLPGTAGWVHKRIMYHSRDAEGRDRAVTGTITFPTDPAPDGGWPVVSYSHGTTGISSSCAPSRGGHPAPLYGVHGVGVVSDYIGLGPVGELHPYLSSAAEGHAVIDAVRAAAQVPGSGAGSRWFSTGPSQGGHSALVAAELGASYAPELTLLGTAAITPPAAFDQTFGPVDQIVTHIIGVMAIYGMQGERPDIDPRHYVSDAVAEHLDVMDEHCLPTIMDTFLLSGEIDHLNFWKQDPRLTEPAKSYFLANEPGLIGTDAPMLIAAGTADIEVNIGRVHVLVDRLCQMGQVLEYHEFEGADHGGVPRLIDADVRRFFAERLAGDPPRNDCP